MKRFLFLILFLSALTLIYAQQDTSQCPFGGRENCTGYCGLFTDNNSDGFCDYSLLTNQNEEKEKKGATTTEKKETQKTTPEPKAIKTSENKETEQSKEEVLQEETETFLIEEQSITATQTTTTTKTNTKALSPYHFWLLLIITLVLYVLSTILVKSKFIKKATHRKIWNFILLVTCLVSCLLGVYIVLAKMYGWTMNYMTLLKLHVDFGIVMTIVAIIHILWHIRYFKNMLKAY